MNFLLDIFALYLFGTILSAMVLLKQGNRNWKDIVKKALYWEPAVSFVKSKLPKKDDKAGE